MNRLLPDKYTNINTCLLTKASYMAKIIIDKKSITVFDMYDLLKLQFSELTDEDFILSLDLLFLYDKINYDVKNDLIRLKSDT